MLNFFKLIFTYFTAILEFLLRRAKFKSLLNKIPIEKIDINFSQFFKELTPVELIKHDFQHINIMSLNKIELILKHFFDSKEYKRLLDKYSLYGLKADYFLDYTNFPITKFNKNKISEYAEKMHYDKSFSINTLKIFILVSDVTMLDGPLTYIEKPFINFNNLDYENYQVKKFTGKCGLSVFGSAVTNLHCASVPSNGRYRRQIMIQLNPYYKAAINNKIYNNQFKKEVKFPFFSTLLNKYNDI